MSINKNLYKSIKSIIQESLEEKYTNAEEPWAELMEKLSKSIKKPIFLDDAGNYNINECEPFHFSIRPIVHGIFDCVCFKDGSDRKIKKYIDFEELEEFIKDELKSKDKNYVDSAFEKSVEDSKDRDAPKNYKEVADNNVVNYDDKAVKADKVDSMNKKEDDPTEPMKEVGDFKRTTDYKETKVVYTMPKLPKNLHNLVVKYKNKRGRPRK